MNSLDAVLATTSELMEILVFNSDTRDFDVETVKVILQRPDVWNELANDQGRGWLFYEKDWCILQPALDALKLRYTIRRRINDMVRVRFLR